jgi:hypothetical protein
MNVTRHSGSWPKVAQFSFQIAGCIFIAGVATLLILTGVVTAPLFRRFICMEDWHRTQFNAKINESMIMNKGAGIALLVVGLALMIYGPKASGSISSNLSRVFAGASAN